MVRNKVSMPGSTISTQETDGMMREAEGQAVPTVMRIVEDIVGCKWTLTILGMIYRGVERPGAIERSVNGLTTKVMNERLAKMTRYGILKRTSYAEVPPRVEYNLTEFGLGFINILDAIEELEQRRSDNSS